MFRTLALGVVMLMLGAGVALADPIEGNWKTAKGSTAQIGTCGGAFCITLKSGKFAGRKIGTMQASGDGRYAGKITDPESDKTYTGKASLSGGSLSMKGCVLGGLICRGETWQRM